MYIYDMREFMPSGRMNFTCDRCHTTSKRGAHRMALRIQLTPGPNTPHSQIASRGYVLYHLCGACGEAFRPHLRVLAFVRAVYGIRVAHAQLYGVVDPELDEAITQHYDNLVDYVDVAMRQEFNRTYGLLREYFPEVDERLAEVARRFVEQEPDCA